MNFEMYGLTDLCRPKQWPTIPKKQMAGSGYPVFGANGIIGYYHSYNHEEPTVLITCRGATCGTINVSAPKSYVTGNSMALDALDESRVCQGYLVHYLRKRTLRDIISGSAQPQITRNGLEKVQIPLPPLAEQKRIAAILDRADALREKRRQAIAKLDTLVQSVFLDMFGDPVTNPKGWEMLSLGSCLAEGAQNGFFGKSDRYGKSGVGVLWISDFINQFYTNKSAHRRALLSKSEIRKYRVKYGDVLFCRSSLNCSSQHLI